MCLGPIRGCIEVGQLLHGVRIDRQPQYLEPRLQPVQGTRGILIPQPVAEPGAQFDANT